MNLIEDRFIVVKMSETICDRRMKEYNLIKSASSGMLTAVTQSFVDILLG